jgi:hypothetical protein
MTGKVITGQDAAKRMPVEVMEALKVRGCSGLK